MSDNLVKVIRSRKYVLDTNVLMHDPDSIFAFQEHDVVIPYVVIRELDNNKTKEGEAGRNARESIRNIESIIRSNISNDCIFDSDYIEVSDKGEVKEVSNIGSNGKIREDLGNLFIENMTCENRLSGETINDDIIISTVILAIEVNKTVGKYESIVLVTKDQAVRIKAWANRIRAEDYKKDKTDKFQLYGKIFMPYDDDTNGINSVRYQVLDGSHGGHKLKKIWNTKQGELENFLYNVGSILGVSIKNIEQECVMQALLDDSISVVALTGPAGVGKTFLAILAALFKKEQNKDLGIVVSRPNIPTNKRYELGFRPGNMNEKMEEWMLPIVDNIDIILSSQKKKTTKKIPKNTKELALQSTESVETISKTSFNGKKAKDLINNESIVIQPLESIRGRSFKGKFIIIDEAQNLTPKDIKTIVSRCGEDTKIVFTGDLDQIDSPYLDKTSNGLSYLISRFLDEENFCYINLQEVVRSRIAEQAATLL